MRKRGLPTPYVYVSGPLTGLDVAELERVAAIYDLIAEASEAIGLAAYRPHRSHTAPGRPMEPGDVWRTDFALVVSAELVVAYVGIPSLGVGSEIEMARAAGVPVILVSEPDRVARVSRLVLGSPAVRDIVVFENHDQLQGLLRDSMRRVPRLERSGTPTANLERLADDVLTAARHRARRSARSISRESDPGTRRHSA